jgi:hypothetical protein
LDKVASFLISYWYLFYFYIMLRKKGLPNVIKKIEAETRTKVKSKRLNHSSIVYGFQLACKMHFLNVECLERSVALYRLLSLNNYESRLCVGVRQKPFLSHAWIETNISELDESKNRDKFHVFLTVYKGGC